uniref:Uncharacterized protein n=1 Tax=Bacillus thuringiensis serovar chinensis CT-43 TaxID=541229 RepID=E7CGS7_BACTU|nr:hypothetical protein pBMB0558_00770 [Bacillus thuringiensis serovar chinensis CT-43]
MVLIFFGIGAYQTYALCTSIEERKLQRTKIAQSIQQKKKKFILVNNKSKFQQKLSTAEIKYIKAWRNHGHSCFLGEIVIRSQFHTTYEPEA